MNGITSHDFISPLETRRQFHFRKCQSPKRVFSKYIQKIKYFTRDFIVWQIFGKYENLNFCKQKSKIFALILSGNKISNLLILSLFWRIYENLNPGFELN